MCVSVYVYTQMVYIAHSTQNTGTLHTLKRSFTLTSQDEQLRASFEMRTQLRTPLQQIQEHKNKVFDCAGIHRIPECVCVRERVCV
jgi:hypothetical protein